MQLGFMRVGMPYALSQLGHMEAVVAGHMMQLGVLLPFQYQVGQSGDDQSDVALVGKLLNNTRCSADLILADSNDPHATVPASLAHISCPGICNVGFTGCFALLAVIPVCTALHTGFPVLLPHTPG
jgi:hypothetical protein